jgi:predicted MPP superfamily phosphohydrolase
VRQLLFTLLGLVVSGLAHAMLGVWLFDAFPRLREHRRRVIAGLVGLVFIGAIARLVAITFHWGVAGSIMTAATCEWLVVLFGAFPLVIVRLLSRGVTAVAPGQDAIGRRQVIERAGGLAVLGATSSVMGWGAVVGRHEFTLEEVPVRIPGLPKALDGYTIAQISDIHIGLLVGEKEIAPGLDKLARTKSDLVVVTGDMVDFDPKYIAETARILGALKARDGVFAILGNHDHYTGGTAVAEALRKAGLDVLVNDGRVIRSKDGGGFSLLGVDDVAARRGGGIGPRLDIAQSAVPKDLAQILLSHQPHTIDIWAGRIALQLSGHTHGGQFNPGFRPADFIMRYVAGRYDVGGTALYVNRGFGVVGPPARVGAPPEVTKIVLVSA